MIDGEVATLECRSLDILRPRWTSTYEEELAALRSAILWILSACIFSLLRRYCLSRNFSGFPQARLAAAYVLPRIVLFRAHESKSAARPASTQPDLFLRVPITSIFSIPSCSTAPFAVRPRLGTGIAFSRFRVRWLMKRFGMFLCRTFAALRPETHVAADAGRHDGGTSLSFCRSQTYTRRPWISSRTAAFAIASATRVPIVPVSLVDPSSITARVTDALAGASTVILHDTIDTKGLTKADVQGAARSVHEIIAAPVEEQLKREAS